MKLISYPHRERFTNHSNKVFFISLYNQPLAFPHCRVNFAECWTKISALRICSSLETLVLLRSCIAPGWHPCWLCWQQGKTGCLESAQSCYKLGKMAFCIELFLVWNMVSVSAQNRTILSMLFCWGRARWF